MATRVTVSDSFAVGFFSPHLFPDLACSTCLAGGRGPLFHPATIPTSASVSYTTPSVTTADHPPSGREPLPVARSYLEKSTDETTVDGVRLQ